VLVLSSFFVGIHDLMGVTEAPNEVTKERLVHEKRFAGYEKEMPI